MKNLTVKQQRFADLVFSGKEFTDAYAAAYPSQKMNPKALRVEAYRTAARPHIRAYLKERQAEERAAASINREDILAAMGKIVKRIGKDAHAPATAVVAAGERAARMLGCDAPTKIEMKVEGSLLHRIRKGVK